MGHYFGLSAPETFVAHDDATVCLSSIYRRHKKVRWHKPAQKIAEKIQKHI